MDVSRVLAGSVGTLSYLERYVNTGSPSGFTGRFTTSSETSPIGKTSSFRLLVAHVDPGQVLFEGGCPPLALGPGDFFLHPDMTGEADWSGAVLTPSHEVTPTSSARTVRLVEPPNCYIKLAYHGLIGRIPRHLTVQHAASALEVSSILRDAIDGRRIDSRFKFFCDVYARVVSRPTSNGTSSEWGFVLREPHPHPSIAPAEPVLIPAFSLFSPDTNSPYDGVLLDQLVRLSGIDPWTYVISGLIQPTLECYFSILKTLGLQLEPHAQNILYQFSDQAIPSHVIARDAESIDKDLDLISELRLSTIIQTDRYKTLRRSDYNYQIMHSFMFDFKLGEYLLEPLAHWLSNATGRLKSDIYSAIRDITKECMRGLPLDFFPEDCWYSYEPVVHDRSQRRPYIRHTGTKFR